MTEAKGKCKKQLKVNTVAQHVGRRPMEGGCDGSRFSGCDTRMWLLLLSRFSRVRLCATPQTAAHQAPPSLGFSRQEPWRGLPFPAPMHESEKGK